MWIFIIILVSIVTLVSGYLAYKKVISLNKYLMPSDLIILQVKVPKEIERSEAKTAPVAAERMFSSLHGLLNTSPEDTYEVINFEVFASAKGIIFYVTLPKVTRNFVEGQIYAHYPGAQIEEVSDYLPSIDSTNKKVILQNMVLAKKSFFPIKTFMDFDVDPLNSITESLSEVKEGDILALQISVKPLEDNWQQTGHDYVSVIKNGDKADSGLGMNALVNALFKSLQFLVWGSPSTQSSGASASPAPKITAVDEIHITSIEEKLTKMGYLTELKIMCIYENEAMMKSYMRSVKGAFKQYTATQSNSFVPGKLNLTNELALNHYSLRGLSKREGYVLNTEELASIFHFPSLVSTPNISFTLSKKGEPPLNLPMEGDVNFFGITTFRNKQVKFGIKNNEDRLRHMYFVGKTGSGKSTLFENMIVQDIKDGRGCGYIDPHGETIEKILTRIPKERVEDVVLIDPSDSEYPIGINVMECPDPRQKNLLASSVLSAIKLQFGSFSWGPRLEYLLNYSLLTLTEVEGTSLLGITRLLTDKNYRRYILEKVSDPMVKKFWNEEYKELEISFGAEAVSPIQNKVGRLLASSTIRNILGQKHSTVKFNEVMDSKKILLVNLSKGKIGEDNANLLGSLIVNRLMFYAMQRASISENRRVPFYLYVDEFQNFATESFVTILSEARKYGLALHLTHQYTAQLPETIKDAILGNVGSIIALTLGAQDASILAPEFAPVFDENDLISQERFHFYCKLYVDGATSKPFSGRSIPPMYNRDEDNSILIKQSSARKYGKERLYVEEKIYQWLDRPFDAGMAIAEKYRALAEAKKGIN